MIYMTKSFTIALSVLLLSSSCSYISYSNALPFIKSATIGNDGIELTNEFIARQPYSFIRVDLGKGANIIMVLLESENNFYTWMSETGEKLVTYNGKVVTTSGLPSNIEILNGSDFKFFGSKKLSSGIFNVMLKNPQAFLEHDYALSIIEDDSTLDYLLIEEKVNVEILKNTYSNFYWVDRTSGKVIRSKQAINPRLPRLRIDFVYKY